MRLVFFNNPNEMKATLPSIILTGFIALFSFMHYESVSAIYAFAGASIGLSHEWVSANNIVISNYGHMVAYFLLIVTGTDD